MIGLEQLKRIADQQGTPIYVYDRQYLLDRATKLQELSQTHNCLLRYAVKANPHTEIIELFDRLGLNFDASSEYEAERLIKLGVEPEKISLSSQQPPSNMLKTLNSGVKFVATSLRQLELAGSSGWQGNLAVRLNPGVGSGHSRRTTTGGVSSSFGIWHEYMPQVLDWASKSGCVIDRIQTHIGSGADAKVWRTVVEEGLKLVEQIPTIKILNLGGGYKVARMPDEKEANMAEILEIFDNAVKAFQKRTGRQLSIEIEPGTFLVANGGYLISQVVDVVDTGREGFNFIKLDTGMNDLLRPTLYGAQHSIEIINDSKAKKDYVVVGHNCESGDLLTPEPGNPEQIKPRSLNQAEIGDTVMIGGVGAYGASMRAIGYNSYPAAKETIL
ncbi:MAG TPA: diaminopimelate decarboxylase [Candidatus Saccharimonadales bacterium]|nr:diaminopimelate decarboxylase [Candidatus Saccharimonadales bacterium]